MAILYRLLLLTLLLVPACDGHPTVVNPTADGRTAGDADPGDTISGGDGELPTAPFQTALTVDTLDGPIRGVADGTLRVFKGIPFAEPPVDDLRLRAPLPVEPWAHTLHATDFGPSCIQEEIPGFTGPTSEDCLTLNVWAHTDEPPRPVMVWIYGGGFVTGGSSTPTYDGAGLAEAADVVVISINYRLGMLGYLATPELQADEPTGSTGNFGLLDQLEALRWIRRNAPAFGGDATNVTVFGESAGGFSICALLGSPMADTLFDKAIIQSGGCHIFPSTDSGFGGGPSAFEAGAALVADLGCAAASNPVACLRDLPASDFILPVADLLVGGGGSLVTAPVIDGVVLSEMPYDRIARGAGPVRPVIIGSNGNEGALFTASDVVVTRSALRGLFLDFTGSALLADELMLLYPLFDFPLHKSAWDAFVGEMLFNCNAYHAAIAHAGPSYAYYLDLAPLVMSTPWGPLHGTDIFYTFGTFSSAGIMPSLFDLETRDLVQQAWGTFAATGVPQVDDPTWPAIASADPRFLQIDLFPNIEETFRDDRCDGLRALGLLP